MYPFPSSCMHACALNQSRTFHSVIHTYVLTHLRTYVRTYVHTHIHIASLPINITKLATHLPTYTIPQCAEEKTRTCSIADLFPTASPSSVPAALHQKVRPAWFAKLRFALRIAELWLWKTSIKIQCPDNPHKPLYYKACWKPNNLRALWAQRSQ